MPGGFVVVGNDGDNPVVMGLTDAGDVQWATTMTGMAEMALALDIPPGGDIVFATNDVLSEHDLEIARLTPDGQPLWVNGYGEGYSLDPTNTSNGGVTSWLMGKGISTPLRRPRTPKSEARTS